MKTNLVSIALVIFFLMVACGKPSQSAIQTAIAQTLAARPTQISEKTSTIQPITNTPRPINTPSPTKTPQPKYGSLVDPVPFNTSGQFNSIDSNGVFNITAKVTQVMRGQEAWNTIYSANPYNDPPPAGMEAILIELYVHNDSTTGTFTIEKYKIFEFYKIVSNGRYLDGLSYHPCCLDNAGLLLLDEIMIAPDGETMGWFGSMVNQTDINPLLALGVNNQGSGGIYFKLTP